MPEDTRVAAILEDIDSRELEDVDDLLVSFLRTCWPTVAAQAQ